MSIYAGNSIKFEILFGAKKEFSEKEIKYIECLDKEFAKILNIFPEFKGESFTRFDILDLD